jgi:hypothetical protein
MKSKLSQLSTYLTGKLDLLGIRLEQLETDVADGTVEPGGLSETETGIHLADFAYEGTLLIERLPADSLGMLLLLIVAWLCANDPDRSGRNLPWPSVETIALGSGLLDAVVEIRFVDEFFGSLSEDGPIEMGGLRYAPDGYELRVAESGNVAGAPTEAEA